MIINPREPINIKELKNLYNLCWDLDTCHPLFKDEWVPHKRAIGQNDITALSIFSIFGGKILFCNAKKCGNYFWNRFPTGQEVDLTNWPHRLKIVDLKKSAPKEIKDLIIFIQNRDEYYRYQRFIILHLRVYEVLRKNKNLLFGFV